MWNGEHTDNYPWIGCYEVKRGTVLRIFLSRSISKPARTRQHIGVLADNGRMPRSRRLYAPQALHHLIARFVNREFRLYGPQERAEYLRRVPTVLAATDSQPLAYALMSSHVHWTVRAGAQPVSRFIHPLHVGVAGWLNRQHGRTGPVFMARYTSVGCEVLPSEVDDGRGGDFRQTGG